MHIFLNLSRIRHADHKPTGWGWRQTARAIHRTKGKRLTRPDRTDVVTRTIVVTKGIVHVEATRRKSHHSNPTVGISGIDYAQKLNPESGGHDEEPFRDCLEYDTSRHVDV